MMIFKEWEMDKILDGTKTQTRRLVKSVPQYMAIDKTYKFDVVPGDFGYIDGEIYQVARRTYTHGGWLNGDVCRKPEWFDVLKWELGQTYAVQPASNKPGVWVKPDGTLLFDAIEHKGFWNANGEWETKRCDGRRHYEALGYKELRIRITAIRRERLQDITHKEAVAEGCKEWDISKEMSRRQYRKAGGKIFTWKVRGENRRYSIFEARAEYATLWNEAHTAPGERWEDNPEVWVLEFERV